MLIFIMLIHTDNFWLFPFYMQLRNKGQEKSSRTDNSTLRKTERMMSWVIHGYVCVFRCRQKEKF